MRTLFCFAFGCLCCCLAGSGYPVGAVHAGEELMPLAAGANSPLRVNVIRITLPSPARRAAAIDDDMTMTAIPGLSSPDLALRDKRARAAARAAALEPPKPFATRPGGAKSRPARIHLPPPVESETGLLLPGFNPPAP